jgi:flagellar protein FliJ
MLSGVSNVKSRDSALRLKRFEASEKARKVADLEHMIREFEQMAVDLDRQISAEEDRTGVKDATHFAYSTFAKAAGQRRSNLRASIEGLVAKLDAAVRERDAAQADLDAVMTADPRDQDRGRRRPDRTASATMR